MPLNFRKLDREVMAGPITLAYWWGEVRELLDEVVNLSPSGIREEWSDVACMGFLWLLAVGIPVGRIPILPGLGLYAALKFTARRDVWKAIFMHHEVVFANHYLIGGGNFKKMAKVRAALALAGCHEVDEAWVTRLQAER